jgi:hypothetical protein
MQSKFFHQLRIQNIWAKVRYNFTSDVHILYFMQRTLEIYSAGKSYSLSYFWHEEQRSEHPVSHHFI